MDQTAREVLALFDQMGNDVLDLHVLFEAGGNDPARREAIIDIVSNLVREGLLEERGNDFYARTQRGKEALQLPGEI